MGAADQPQPQCLVCIKLSSCECQLTHGTLVADDLREALQSADVCCDANIDLLAHNTRVRMEVPWGGLSKM